MFENYATQRRISLSYKRPAMQCFLFFGVSLDKYSIWPLTWDDFTLMWQHTNVQMIMCQKDRLPSAATTLVTLQWHYRERDGVLNRLFAQPCVQAHIKENIKSPRHWLFVKRIHRWPVDSPHKGPVLRKMDPFDNVIMPLKSWFHYMFYIPRSAVTQYTKFVCVYDIKKPVLHIRITLCRIMAITYVHLSYFPPKKFDRVRASVLIWIVLTKQVLFPISFLRIVASF